MIDIVFSYSAYGSLKCSQVPADSKDVLVYDSLLSVGDITPESFTKRRQETIVALYNIFPECNADSFANSSANSSDTYKTNLLALQNAAKKDSEIRIWYSNLPDDMCGLLWFLWDIYTQKINFKLVHLIKLPEYELTGSKEIVVRCGWGELAPNEWESYLSYAKTINDSFIHYCASLWSALQLENAPLRAFINNQIVSVPENFYDYFIYKEVNLQSQEFNEGRLIGTILGKYQLGITDIWIANRIEKMISDQYVCIVGDSPHTSTIYEQRLKKVVEKQTKS